MLTSNSLKVNRNGSLCFITFPQFEDDNLLHAFTTRKGGVSKGDNSFMNLSFKTGDERAAVVENYNIICSAIGVEVGNIVLSQQTHTANIRIVTKEDCGKGIFKPSDFTDIDALVTNEKGVAIVTHSADCCLVGFYDKSKRVIAAAHAGWRGTVKQIVRNTVIMMKQKYGSNPQDISAIIAPCVLKCCYEVDQPVFEVFKKSQAFCMEKIFFPKDNGKYMLDLAEANRQALNDSGIPDTNIDITDICTNCNSEDFHSHRATGGKRGVNALIMQLKEC